jgi:hypothetical protein
MMIRGNVIPEEAIDAAVVRMRASDFTAADLHAVLGPALTPRLRTTKGLVSTLAHRMISRHRAVGDLEKIGESWRWSGPLDAGPAA